ncbi:hypothetical protein A3B32_00105 [Candidatus Uhrbacteria bacterium RIFCSPLOWO2_01_FULL_53_9]|nr:MAG: hypothetical protein A3B32_00105 [Candidatus Uhrbacteria bacterium RIFCSPLOWO2_01_FULL_53_9]
MIEVDMCVRCAQTGMWLLTHETLTATGKTLLAMRELLDRGHEALFDRIVTATRDGHLHCTSFDGAPLSILRDVGLITPENAEITLEASSVIKEYCRSNGVTFSVEVPGYPDRNLTKTAGQPS